jgi:hypothetical protein
MQMRKGQGKQFHNASNKKLWSILFWVPPSMQQFAAFFFFTLLLFSRRLVGCCAWQRLSFAAKFALLVA